MKRNSITSSIHSIYLYAYGQRESHIYGITIKNSRLDSGGNSIYLDARAYEIFYSSANIYNVSIYESEIVGSENGINIYATGRYSSYGYNIHIQKNNISNCGSAGLRMEIQNYSPKNPYDASITYNIISRNVYGVLVIGIKTNITYNSIAYNTYGIQYINSTDNVARYNDIYQNSIFGMYIEQSNVDAKYNYWGDESGPKHLTLNLLGMGNSVNGNGEDLVFNPWLDSPTIRPNEKPVAILKVSRETATVGETIIFDASSSYDDVMVKYYFIDFGDGVNTGWVDTPTVQHIYNTEGVYNVKLVVKDDLGVVSDPLYKTVTIVVAKAEFSVSELAINPKKVKIGETVLISVSITNIGNMQGTYILTLFINGSTEATQTIGLSPGDARIVEFQVIKNEPGTYIVEVDGLKDSFEVLELTPARFILSDLTILPSEVEAGESITISVKVANEGEEDGTYTIQLKINNETIDTETISLSGGESKVVKFTYTIMHPGTYAIEVDGLKRTLNVAEHMPPGQGWQPWQQFMGQQQLYLLLGLIIIVILVVVISARRR